MLTGKKQLVCSRERNAPPKSRSSSEPTQRKDNSFKLHTSQITSNHQPSPFLRRFRLPPLSNNPSTSYDDLMSPVCDGLQADNVLYQNALSWTSSASTGGGLAGPADRKPADSKPSAANSTSTITTTTSSDYFSMTDSMYSSTDASEFPAAPTAAAVAESSSRAMAAVLRQIHADTQEIERRSREINETFPD